MTTGCWDRKFCLHASPWEAESKLAQETKQNLASKRQGAGKMSKQVKALASRQYKLDSLSLLSRTNVKVEGKNQLYKLSSDLYSLNDMCTLVPTSDITYTHREKNHKI